jgi:hypothetical protein
MVQDRVALIGEGSPIRRNAEAPTGASLAEPEYLLRPPLWPSSEDRIGATFGAKSRCLAPSPEEAKLAAVGFPLSGGPTSRRVGPDVFVGRPSPTREARASPSGRSVHSGGRQRTSRSLSRRVVRRCPSLSDSRRTLGGWRMALRPNCGSGGPEVDFGSVSDAFDVTLQAREMVEPWRSAHLTKACPAAAVPSSVSCLSIHPREPSG